MKANTKMSDIKEITAEELVAVLKFTPRKYTVSMWGYGGEAYAGRVSRETYEYFKENKIDIEEYASDWDNKFDDVPRELMPFSPGSPYDCDSLFHSSGASLDNSNEIIINDETGDAHWSCALGADELELAGVTVESFGGAALGEEIGDNEVAFWGGNGEKGSFFEGDVLLTAPFDPKKLKISYEDCDGWYIINMIEYDGEEIDGSNGYGTTGKWTENKWVLGVNVEEYEAVSREDMDDEEESDPEEETTWPEPACASETVYPELTDWFPKTVKPVRIGSYQTHVTIKPVWPWPAETMLEWTGKNWKDTDGNVIKDVVEWRGVLGPTE